MKKFFNTTGPCDPTKHYMIDPLSRCQNLRGLIDQEAYFVIHAPRQSGKTTLLESLAQKLTAEGTYAALRVSCEVGQALGGNIDKVEAAILQMLKSASEIRLPKQIQPAQPWPESPTGTRLNEALRAWAEHCPLPVVLFLDEIDALLNESLEAVLRQLRNGFSYRSKAFPQSVVLCGLRGCAGLQSGFGWNSHAGHCGPL